jgi:hypothetical protein
MKLRLIATVSALLFVSSFSWAVEFKFGGDYRLRGFYLNNVTDQTDSTIDRASYYSSRFLLTTTATEDKVNGVVTLLLGQSGGTGNRLLGDTAYGPDESVVGLLEAYIQANFRSWSFKGGRQVFKLGHSVVLEDALDGLRVDTRTGPALLTVAALKIVELTNEDVVAIGNTSLSDQSNDADLYVVNAGFGTVDLFAAYLVDRAATLVMPAPDPAHEFTLLTVGASGSLELVGIALRGEVDFLTGEHETTADTLDVGGMNVVLGGRMQMGIPIGLDLIYATGDDLSDADVNVNGLNGNYPVGIIITNGGARSLAPKDGTCLSINGGSLGGVPNCIGGAGLMAVKLSTGMKNRRVSLDFAGIWARSVEEPVVDGDTDIGIELDGTVTYTLTKNLTALGGVGYLVSGDFFGPDADNQLVMVSQLSYTF